jgi:hypothetical protein
MKNLNLPRVLLLPIVMLLLSFLLVGEVSAQGLLTRTFRTKTFTHTTSRTDTSGIVIPNEYQYVTLATATKGTDSMIVKVYVDYLIGSNWLTIRDTLKFGSVTTTTDKSKGWVLRQPGTDLIPGATQLRVRNVLTGFSTGDSTSATYYDQYFLWRRQ